MDILETEPSVTCIGKDTKPFAHEAGVWVESTQSVWFSSNLYCNDERNPKHPHLKSKWAEISTINVSTGEVKTHQDLLDYIKTPNGGCPFGAYVLFCEQGCGPDEPSSLVAVHPKDPSRKPITILNNYHGRQFNSLNDAVVLPPPEGVKHENQQSLSTLPDGPPPGSTLWFTDPTYGVEQGFRCPAQLPSQVYCFDPHTGVVRAVADGFDHCNGICFSPEGKVCYVTDSGHCHGSGTQDPHKPSTM